MKTNPKNLKQARVIGGFLGLIGFIIGVVLMNAVLKPSVQFQLVNAAAELNKSLPRMVGEYVRIDSAEALDNKTLKFNYTFVKHTKADLEPVADLKQQLQESIISDSKGDEDFATLKKNNVTLVYSYKDMNNQPLIEITISPQQY